jgi:hypothetical protein
MAAAFDDTDSYWSTIRPLRDDRPSVKTQFYRPMQPQKLNALRPHWLRISHDRR